ncbi:MAG: DUF362 domain-containing protein [Candidatus Zixiibacteriota bacterium]
MSKIFKRITRRNFIKSAGVATIGIATVGIPSLADEIVSNYKTKVILIRNENVVGDKGKINGDIVQQMLDEAIIKLIGKKDIVSCWKEMIVPEDIVGIKTNEWANLPTTTEVEQAIKKRVMDAGVSEKNIGIDDRGVLNNPIFKNSTALINARPMRTHSWSGVGSLIKNYIMFDPNPPKYHANSCASLAEVWDLPIVKGKTRLNVLVMFTPQFNTIGPHHFDKEFTWNYGGLIVGFDPVACDTVGLKIIQEKRKLYFGDDRPIKPIAHHIQIADTQYKLGTSDMDKIELIKLGWDKDWLI